MSVNQEQVLDDANLQADQEIADQDTDNDGGNSEPQIDYEKEARDMGWNPEYNGPNKKSAKQFYDDGLNILPIVQANLGKEREKVTALEARLQETEENTKRSLAAMQKHFERETERKIAELAQRKEKAVQNADVEAFKKIEQEEKDLLNPKEDAEDKSKSAKHFKSDPVIQQWEKENPWYGTDEDLTDYANGYTGRLRPTTDKTGRDFLDLVAEQVKKKFPDKFRNQRKDNFSGAAPRSGQPPAKTASYESLPPSAKRQFDYAVNRGLLKDTPESRQQYAKDFMEAE